MSAYSDIIIKATGASGDDVIIIENIMREEIFHSTLDWQTARQFAAAARAAQVRLRDDYEFYHLVLADRRLAFEESKLEQSLNQATPGSASAISFQDELDSVRQSLATTRESLERLFDKTSSPA